MSEEILATTLYLTFAIYSLGRLFISPRIFPGIGGGVMAAAPLEENSRKHNNVMYKDLVDLNYRIVGILIIESAVSIGTFVLCFTMAMNNSTPWFIAIISLLFYIITNAIKINAERNVERMKNIANVLLDSTKNE